MGEPFLESVDNIQPSQLYISSAKLERVLAYLDVSDVKSMDPIPIRLLDGRPVYTDGHTRAYAASAAGSRLIRVHWDEDELDWEAYRICVDWCREAGISTIGDLAGRVITTDLYETLWLQRCAEMQRELTSIRSRS